MTIPYIPAGPIGEPRPQPPATPELNKRRAIIASEGHKAIQGFLSWLSEDHARPDGGLGLVRFQHGTKTSVYESEFENILARYYGLDLNKIAAERDALLAYIREHNLS